MRIPPIMEKKRSTGGHRSAGHVTGEEFVFQGESNCGVEWERLKGELECISIVDEIKQVN